MQLPNTGQMEFFCDQKRSGRPRKTSVRNNRTMHRIVVRSPMSSCKKVRAILHFKETDVSISPVSRRLNKEFDLPSRKPAQKPQFTPVMKQKKIDFAKRHRHWAVSQWRRVLFSDKSTIQQFVVPKRHLRKSRGKRYNKRHTVQTIKNPQVK